jgi:hypothetical protein
MGYEPGRYKNQAMHPESHEDARAIARLMSEAVGSRVSVPDAIRVILQDARAKWEKKAAGRKGKP